MDASVVSAAVEGDLDEVVLRKIGDHIGFSVGSVYGRAGKQHLLRALAGYNNAARFSPWIVILDLARIMHDAENFCGDSGGKRAIHVANRCSNELPRVSTLCHSHHDRRYAASVRSARRPPQETNRRFRTRQSILQWRCTGAAGVGA